MEERAAMVVGEGSIAMQVRRGRTTKKGGEGKRGRRGVRGRGVGMNGGGRQRREYDDEKDNEGIMPAREGRIGRDERLR